MSAFDKCLIDVELEEDIKELGLRGTIIPSDFPELTEALLNA